MILALQENEYYDEDDWREFISALLDDFGEFGVQTCVSFLDTDPQLLRDGMKTNYNGIFSKSRYC